MSTLTADFVKSKDLAIVTTQRPGEKPERQVVCGPSCAFPGCGRDICDTGGRSVEVKLDLANSDYAAGGYCFDPNIFGGLCQIKDLVVLGGTDPYGCPIVPLGCALALTDDQCPKIQVFDKAGEVADGWVPTGDVTCVWVRVWGW